MLRFGSAVAVYLPGKIAASGAEVVVEVISSCPRLSVFNGIIAPRYPMTQQMLKLRIGIYIWYVIGTLSHLDRA